MTRSFWECLERFSLSLTSIILKESRLLAFCEDIQLDGKTSEERSLLFLCILFSFQSSAGPTALPMKDLSVNIKKVRTFFPNLEFTHSEFSHDHHWTLSNALMLVYVSILFMIMRFQKKICTRIWFSVKTIGLGSSDIMPLAALKVYFLTWTLSRWTSVTMTTRVPLLTDGSPCDDTVLSAVGASSHLISIATLNHGHFYLVCYGWGVWALGSGITCQGINNRLRTWACACLYFTNIWIIVDL